MPSSIKKWLEDVKPGYGDRYVGAFDEVGVEDISDLAELGEGEAFEELERALQARGAKLVQLQKIRKALMTIATAQRAGSAPTAAGVAAAGGLASHPALKAMRSLDAAPNTRAEKQMLKNVFGIGLPVMKPKQRQAAVTPPSPMGYTLMQAGDGPRIYVVHDIDGDHQAAGSAFRRLAALLGTCQVVALEYNDEARMCGTLPALAALYNQRILSAAHGGSPKSIYVAGYSMGCILAHQMALQFQEAGQQVGLLLFGSEVVWPNEGSSTRRMGGYEWLGGSIEAALFVARKVGGVDFAEGEVNSLLSCRAEERDANKVHMRVYWKLCGPRDMPYEDFQHTVSTGARNMDMLRAMMWRFMPQKNFEGYTLLVAAPESPEFYAAQDVNSRHCICLKPLWIPGTGNHYNMLDGPQAAVVADAVLSCLREQGEPVGAAPAAPAFSALQPPAQAAPPAQAMPQAVAAVPARRTESIVPSVTQEDVNKTVIGMVNSIAMDPLQMDSNLIDSGFDSICLSLLVSQIQTDFSVEVSQAYLMEIESVSDLSKHLKANMPAAAAAAPALPAGPAQPQMQYPQPQVQQPQAAGLPAAEPVPMPSDSAPAASAVAAAPPAGSPGMEVLSDGDGGPCVYMVHGIDGDIWGIGNSFRAVAPLLAPCRCTALALDEEALACKTLPALAALYNRRVFSDSQQRLGRPVVVMGYSMGCVLAHQMALQFQTSGFSVALVMVDFEISWPPAPTTKRIGGYAWLGGEFEAALLITRGMGSESQLWAAREIEELLAMQPHERSAAVLQAKAYQEIASRRKGFRVSDFNTFVAKGSRNMDRLHAMAGEKFEPTGVFSGDALLVLAPESPENTEPAMEINGKYCSKMTVAQALGTHYNILQPEKAPGAARAILGFLNGLGHAVPRSPKIDVKGLKLLQDGDGPRVYMVHGIESNLHGVGQAYMALAPQLAPCACLAFAFDNEAMACQDYDGLIGLYCKRTWEDAQFYPGRPIVIMGYSMGCVMAHSIALKFQEMGVKTSLVMIDFEITWPPDPTAFRIGGYEWLGGELEAALLNCRAYGAHFHKWSSEEIVKYIALPKEERDMTGFVSRICMKLVTEMRGMTMRVFEDMTVKGGHAMQRLYEICGKVVPKGVYHGPNILIVAPESPENFDPATQINSKYCDSMQVVPAVGTHYNILQQDKAHVTASRCLSFFKSIGFDIPHVPTLRGSDSIEVLREGGAEDPIVYLVHDVDGAAEGLGRCCRVLAERLGPCHCRAVAFSKERLGIDNLEVLVGILGYLLRQDAHLFQGRPVCLAGHALGATLAHALAVNFQREAAAVRLLLVDPDLHTPLQSEWLGIRAEGILFSARCRGQEGKQWAQREEAALAAMPPEQRDVGALAARLAQELGDRQEASSPEEVNRLFSRWLHCLLGQYRPEVFQGSTLAVLPVEPAERFDLAKEGVAKCCSSLEAVALPGERGQLLQPERADAAAGSLLEFVRRTVREAIAVPAPSQAPVANGHGLEALPGAAGV